MENIKEKTKKESYFLRLRKDVKKHYALYLLFIPVLIFFIIFSYVPMLGIRMAFYDYIPRLGYEGSNFVGFKHFIAFFTNPDFGQIMFNTFIINVWDLIFSFPAPIILALMFFELKSKKTRSVIQVVTYLPHFISLVVVCGMTIQFTKSDGLFSNLLTLFGVPPKNIMQNPQSYIPIFIGTNIWQNVGFASIVFFAALCSVDTQLFDAAKVDGAGRLRRIWMVSIPCILPTIMIMFILRMGSMLNVGFEKVYLLQNDFNSTVSDVISTHLYKIGLSGQQYSYGAAVGLFNSVVSLVFLLVTNLLSKKTEISLF